MTTLPVFALFVPVTQKRSRMLQKYKFFEKKDINLICFASFVAVSLSDNSAMIYKTSIITINTLN
jgi:hypothetical protein